MMAINLREINKDNWDIATSLAVADDQQAFVRPNWFSILQVIYAEIDLYDRGIYNDNEMVGYAMMGQDPDDQSGFIGRLMIDQKHQGKGYGRAAMLLILDDLKARYKLSEILIRFHPENVGARKLYAGLGFVDTGDVAHGELVFRLTVNG